MCFRSREYHTLPRTREGRLLAELTLSHVDDIQETFSESDLGMDGDAKFHLFYQGNYAIDLCDGPHLFDVTWCMKKLLKGSLAKTEFLWNRNRVLPTVVYTTLTMTDSQ